MIPASRVHTCD